MQPFRHDFHVLKMILLDSPCTQSHSLGQICLPCFYPLSLSAQLNVCSSESLPYSKEQNSPSLCLPRHDGKAISPAPRAGDTD